MSYWKNNDLNTLPHELRHNSVFARELIIVEDFFDDPVAVRNRILAADFEVPPNPKQGVISFNTAIPEDILGEIKPKIERQLEKHVRFHPRSKCAMTFEHVPLNCVCHVDGGDGMQMFNWTVVIYLNPPEQCSGGTDFFRHLPTGHICNENGTEYYHQDFRDPSKWEMIERVEMKFNRALLAPAWRFHSLAYTFGNEKENARLTINPKVIAYE